MLHRLKNLGEAQGPDQTCHQRALYRQLQKCKEDPLESYVPPRSQETASKMLESYYGQDRFGALLLQNRSNGGWQRGRGPDS